MHRVAIIGSGGAGKSTLARRLAAITGLPLVHLDREFWRPGWKPTPDAEWQARVRALVAGERWILDGNYGGTMGLRFAAADTIIWLDYPRLLCTWRAFRRGASQWDSRTDMAPGCPERVDPGFLRWVWSYPDSQRPDVKRLLREHARGKRVVVLRDDRAADRFVGRVARLQGAAGRDGIQPATVADAGIIAAIHVAGWRAAYGHIFPESAFATTGIDRRLADLREWFAAPPEGERMWVAVRNGLVSAFAYTRPGTDEDIERGGELKLFYTRPGLRGIGIGSALFDHAVGDLRARGYEPYLYTLRENTAARRWYEKRGWRHDGRTQLWSRTNEYPEIDECRYRPAED